MQRIMRETTPFEFTTCAEYLRAARQSHPGNRKGTLTLDRWCSQLGYRSPRSVAMVLKGQRVPSAEMMEKLSINLKHTEKEHRYFGLLVQLDRYRQQKRDTQDIVVQMERLNPRLKESPFFCDNQLFSYLSDWYFFPIKQLIASPGFRDDAAWIRERLRGKVTIRQIKDAIETMVRLEILERTKEGLTVKKACVRSADDVPMRSGRVHQKQMMTRAAEALEEQDVNEREISSATFRMDPARIPQAKEALREFRKSFAEEFLDEKSESIFQINIQYFQHTESNRKG